MVFCDSLRYNIFEALSSLAEQVRSWWYEPISNYVMSWLWLLVCYVMEVYIIYIHYCVKYCKEICLLFHCNCTARVMYLGLKQTLCCSGWLHGFSLSLNLRSYGQETLVHSCTVHVLISVKGAVTACLKLTLNCMNEKSFYEKSSCPIIQWRDPDPLQFGLFHHNCSQRGIY